MLLLSLQLPIPLFVMAVQLVLLKRMLVIQDQRMALDQGRTKPPIQRFISLHAKERTVRNSCYRLPPLHWTS